MKFAVENFKIFKERQEFDIRPITILVGPNGSGKSSVIRAMEVLSNLKVPDYMYSLEQYIIHLERSYEENNNSLLSKYKFFFQNESNVNQDVVFEIKKDFIISGVNLGEINLRLKLSAQTIEIDIFESETKEIILSLSDLWTLEINIPYFIKAHEKIVKLAAKNKNVYQAIDKSSNFLNVKYWDTGEVLLNMTEEDFFTKHNLSFNEFAKQVSDKFWTGKNIPISKNHFEKYYINFKYIFRGSLEDHFGNLDFSVTDDNSGEAVKNFINNFIMLNLTEFITKSIEEYTNINSVTTNRMARKKLDIENPINELEKALYHTYNLRKHDRNKEILLIEKLKEYLSENFLGLADNVSLDFDPETDSVSFFIHQKGKKFKYSQLGYGAINCLSILINLSLAHAGIGFGLKKIEDYILYDTDTDRPTFVGFHKTILAIEEPEMNLHPSAQSKLADVFADSVNNHNTTLILETHSEYLIRKIQYLVAKKVLSPDQVQIYYFNDEANVKKGAERVYPINISKDGSLSKPFGPGFFDEAGKIKYELLLLSEPQKN